MDVFVGAFACSVVDALVGALEGALEGALGSTCALASSWAGACALARGLVSAFLDSGVPISEGVMSDKLVVGRVVSFEVSGAGLNAAKELRRDALDLEAVKALPSMERGRRTRSDTPAAFVGSGLMVREPGGTFKRTLSGGMTLCVSTHRLTVKLRSSATVLALIAFRAADESVAVL